MRPGLTYTALGGSALLLDVQVTELTTGRLDDADLLALGVVGGATPLPLLVYSPNNSKILNRLLQRSGLRCDVRR